LDTSSEASGEGGRAIHYISSSPLATEEDAVPIPKAIKIDKIPILSY